MYCKQIAVLSIACWLWPVAALGAESPSDTIISPLSIPATKPPPAVSELLASMIQQRKNLNYEGTFTYQNSSGTEGFKLQHWLHEGSEFQRLYHLNGPARETIIEKSIDCLPVGEQLVLGRIDDLHHNLANLSQYYSFSIRGLERVAGRVTTVLQLVPKDADRFGYFFSIDRETGLLLKSLLLDENQRVVEQFQFLDLNTNPDLAQFNAEPSTELSYKVSGDEIAGCSAQGAATLVNWHVAWLPEGFTLSGKRTVRNDVEMLMYTDGLSTFSIFLDPVVGQLVIEGRAQRGATNFYMAGLKRGSQTYQLTIVGEIPKAVAEKLGQSIRAVNPAS